LKKANIITLVRMFSVSVIICSHNPRDEYLHRVIDALRAQTLPTKDWELLLVDNVSDKALVEHFNLSWHPNGRHFREDKIGKTHALLRGIGESRGELLVVVDDDNVLRQDYLQICLKISGEYPQLGAWGGSCIPEYEIEPPAELRPWLSGLVIEKITEPVWAKLPVGGRALPPGAGMAIRRRVAEYYREQVLRDPLRQALDRSGRSLGSGGDSDIALTGFTLGFGAGRFPDLELTHLISAQRLTLNYLEPLFEGFGYSGIILTAVHDTLKWDQKRYPHLFKKSRFRGVLLSIFMLAMRKGRVERRLKLAEERGRQAAIEELERLGDFGNLMPP
jgi:glycosyltransferase involved in cell wall biosynthesis